MRSVIIEDENRNRIVLESLLETYCQDVEVIGHADGVGSGLKLINETDPDLIFMDIRIIGGTGFDILEKLDTIHAKIIFITAYDQYAFKAFKFSAIDYLLKPIDIDELKRAVQRAKASDSTLNEQQIQSLLTNLKNPALEDPVLLVSTLETIEFIRINEIARIEAQGGYSNIIMKDQKKLLASKVLKEFDNLLKDYSFFRVHQSHLINLTWIDKYIKGQHCVVLRDGVKIQIARNRKESFFEVLGKWT